MAKGRSRDAHMYHSKRQKNVLTSKKNKGLKTIIELLHIMLAHPVQAKLEPGIELQGKKLSHFLCITMRNNGVK